MFGLAGPGALADVAADPLGVVRPTGDQFGIRGLDFLRVRGDVAIQQDAMGGAVQQVAGVGQAAVLADRGQQQPSWWRLGDSNSGPPLEGLPGGGCAGGLACGSLAPR